MGHHKRSRSRSRSRSHTAKQGKEESTRRSRHKHHHRGHREPEKQLDTDSDFYLANAEFRVWLNEAKGLLFHDISSDESHRYFRKFVKAWNRGYLEDKYYKGQLRQSGTDASTHRTSHEWNIKDVNEHQLERVSDRVVLDSMSGPLKEKSITSEPVPSARTIGPTLPTTREAVEDIVDREDRERIEQLIRQKDRREHRKLQDVVHEELIPKASSGREAQLEKKKVLNQKRREREESPEPRMSEADLLGSSEGDYQTLLMKQKEKEKAKVTDRYASLAERITSYRAREDEAMQPFRQYLAQKGRITIRPREEGE